MYCKVKKISWNSLYSLFVKCTLLQLSTILFVLCNLWGSTYHHTRQIEYSLFSVWFFFFHAQSYIETLVIDGVLYSSHHHPSFFQFFSFPSSYTNTSTLLVLCFKIIPIIIPNNNKPILQWLLHYHIHLLFHKLRLDVYVFYVRDLLMETCFQKVFSHLQVGEEEKVELQRFNLCFDSSSSTTTTTLVYNVTIAYILFSPH